jgi:predicted metal-binding membrane protein
MARSTETPSAPAAAASPSSSALVQPRVLALASIALLAGLAWIYLGLMVGAATRASLAPGTGILDLVMAGRLDAAGRAAWDVLCRPGFGHMEGHFAAAAGGGLALVYLMWSAMALAMMLPTAAPMVLTYAGIAETAAGKNERVVSPLILAAGYVSVWLGFAAMATALQWGLMRLALLDSGLESSSPLFSGAIFVGAGAYQFSPLKHACVTVCQRPFPYLFSRWSAKPGSVFRLGLEQGLYCLGCCWAMMLVMFAVGVMNIVWMAALGSIMAVEKTVRTNRFGHAVGVVLIAAGAVLVVSSVIAHWPAR